MPLNTISYGAAKKCIDTPRTPRTPCLVQPHIQLSVYLTAHVMDSHAQMPQRATWKQMGSNRQSCWAGQKP